MTLENNSIGFFIMFFKVFKDYLRIFLTLLNVILMTTDMLYNYMRIDSVSDRFFFLIATSITCFRIMESMSR